MGHSIDELCSLKEKVAIITGGAMGIGQGIAARLAEAGAIVVIADLDEAAGQSTAHELGGTFVRTDVSDQTEVQAMVQHTVSAHGSLDILVNNAGIYPNDPLSEMYREAFDRVLAVNLKSVFLATKAASAQMIPQGRGGQIINITSIDAIHPSMVGLAHYDASKHGVWGFTKNVALELAPHKIWVNAIAPGGIRTPGVAKQSSGIDEATIRAFQEKIPMNRFGDPDEIGRVALFLASELSSYMTGAQLVVDGGVLLR